MLARFFKRNGLLLTFFAFYLLMTALVLLVIDKQFFQVKKKELITNDIGWFINQAVGQQRLDHLHATALETLQARKNQEQNPASQEMPVVSKAQETLRREIHEVLNGDNIIFRIAIKPEAPESDPTIRHPTTERGSEPFITDIQTNKFLKFNNFTNSLFLRNFWGSASLPVSDANNKIYGRLLIYYTSPLGDTEIEELTNRYRWRSLFIVLILTVLAAAFARSLLLPQREVLHCLESSTPHQTLFIPNPSSRLEILYNRMALDAVFARLHSQLREEISRRPQMTAWEVISFVCQSFGDQIQPPLVVCSEWMAEAPGRMHPTGPQVVSGSYSSRVPQADAIEQAQQAMPHDGRTEARFSYAGPGPSCHGALHIMSDPDRAGIRYLFALAMSSSNSEGEYHSTQQILEQLIDLMEAGLQSLSLRNRLLVQERGRANISLSRNLGHDLTNIIATSKLELMALDRLLSKGELPDDPRRRGILIDSLHGLLRSVRFMQETVNLYRAYAFLQHPVLETHDGNKLVSDTLELFGMSISGKVQLQQDLSPDAPRCVVDPRLIKLALFNMFTNSLEALRKKQDDPSARGWIRVITRPSVRGGLCIAIEDSGTGILNSQGEPALPHEIEKIFELGYTSRRISDSQGEGLGLNWVRTIVQELHGGAIFAENVEGAGARFVLSFPSIEQAPVTENAEKVAHERLKAMWAAGNGQSEAEG